MPALPDPHSQSEPWLRLENIVDRFEEAFRQGRQPLLDDFLPPDAANLPNLRLELIVTELELRLRSGEPARVEDYLARYADLNADPEAIRTLVVAVFHLRRLREPNLSIEEYQRRFPAQVAEGALEASHAFTDFASALPQVPGYEVLEKIGRGGMGVVYKARQTGLQRLIALKTIRGGRLADREQRQRFLTEAQALARLDHPNVVAIHAVIEHEGVLFFAQEYLGESTLADRLTQEAMPSNQAVSLTATLARAVAVAHAAGIVHRDLKPANVLVASDGTPKISDFGLARLLDVPERQTASNVILGTPAYMAPEQASGHAKNIGSAADVYALGVIFYEMLVGRTPFRGVNHMDVLYQVVNDEPIPPRRLQPKLPRDLETICLTCLHKDPSKRYTAAGLAEDLERWQKGMPIQARPAGIPERLHKWTRRHTALASLAVVVVTALALQLAAALYFTQRLRHERDEAVHEKQRAESAMEEMHQQRQRAEKNLRLAMDQLLIRQLKIESPVYRRLLPEPAFQRLRQELAAEALQRLQTLIEQGVDEPARRFEKATAYLYMGRLHGFESQRRQALAAYERAIALFRSLITDFPEDVLYREELAQTFLFVAYELRRGAQTAPQDREQMGKKARQAIRAALDNYRAAVRLAPDDLRGLNYLAWTLATCEYRELCQPDEAVFHAEKLTSLANRASYWNTLGVAYYSNRQYEKAIAALKKSLLLPGSSPQAYSWYYLAACHSKLGQPNEARIWYEKAHDWMVKNRLPNDDDDAHRLETEVKEVLGLREGK